MQGEFLLEGSGAGLEPEPHLPLLGSLPPPPKLPTPRDGSLQPTLQGVCKETELRLVPGPFILMDPVLPARAGCPHSALSTPSPQDIFPANTAAEARGDAHGSSAGSALGFLLLGLVEPSGLGSALPVSPKPQKAAPQTQPSPPTFPREGGSQS